MLRKNSTPVPGILPYRDTNNTSIKYAESDVKVASVNPQNQYDSDYEPLIGSPPAKTFTTELSEYDMQHFTATGRPAPKFKASALANLSGGESYSIPQLLPRRYTDDSIIPAIVTNIIPSSRSPGEVQVDGGRRKSFMSKFKSGGGERKLDLNKDGFIKMKVVYMPRRDYLKNFARDEKGEYIGKEIFRQWTEDELESAFGQYAPKPEERKGYRVPT